MPTPRPINPPTAQPMIIFFIASASATVFRPQGYRNFSITPGAERFLKRALSLSFSKRCPVTRYDRRHYKTTEFLTGKFPVPFPAYRKIHSLAWGTGNFNACGKDLFSDGNSVDKAFISGHLPGTVLIAPFSENVEYPAQENRPLSRNLLRSYGLSGLRIRQLMPFRFGVPNSRPRFSVDVSML